MKKGTVFERVFAGFFTLFIGICVLAHAGPVSQTIIDQVLDDDPTAVNATVGMAEFEQVAFFVDYNETEVGGGVSGAVTVQFSYDGTTFLSGSFYDLAGGSTLQTSETLSSDSNYFFWLDPEMTVPFVKVIITGTGTDADDAIDTQVYLRGKK